MIDLQAARLQPEELVDMSEKLRLMEKGIERFKINGKGMFEDNIFSAGSSFKDICQVSESLTQIFQLRLSCDKAIRELQQELNDNADFSKGLPRDLPIEQKKIVWDKTPKKPTT